MNQLELEIIQVLSSLKNDYGVLELKAEFEAEGSRLDELSRLKDVMGHVGLPLILKVGGVEAVTDIFNCLVVGCKCIIAPMAETAFALSKFVEAVDQFVPQDNDTEFAWNMETITAYRNLDSMFDVTKNTRLKALTVGRVDLTGSMGKDRAAVESEEIFAICRDTFSRARQHGMTTGLGGAISVKSVDFIRRLNQEKLIDKFETRKVVFHPDAINNAESAIMMAIRFELLWLKSKRRYYGGIKAEDESRIEMLEKRLADAPRMAPLKKAG